MGIPSGDNVRARKSTARAKAQELAIGSNSYNSAILPRHVANRAGRSDGDGRRIQRPYFDPGPGS